MSKPEPLHILLIGNPSEGFRAVGPFSTFDAAELYSRHRSIGFEMEADWIMTLHAPLREMWADPIDRLACVGVLLYETGECIENASPGEVETSLGEVSEMIEHLAELATADTEG